MCGASKVTHLLRTNPPDVVEGAALAFDEAVLEASLHQLARAEVSGKPIAGAPVIGSQALLAGVPLL